MSETTQQLTLAEAQEMGFTEEELAILTEAGVLVEESRRGPWEPATLDDVTWIVRKRKQIRFEIAERERWHAEAIARLERAERALARWDELCARITAFHLPRRKDGSYATKSLPIDGALLKLTASKGGPKVTDEAAVLEWLRTELVKESGGEIPAELVDAVKATVTLTFTGSQALDVLQDPDYEGLAKPKVLHKPVQELAAAVYPDPIPGVEIVPPSERWSWE